MFTHNISKNINTFLPTVYTVIPPYPHPIPSKPIRNHTVYTAHTTPNHWWTKPQHRIPLHAYPYENGNTRLGLDTYHYICRCEQVSECIKRKRKRKGRDAESWARGLVGSSRLVWKQATNVRLNPREERASERSTIHMYCTYQFHGDLPTPYYVRSSRGALL